MRAAGLHAIETVLASQAVLIRSNKPANEHDGLIERITSRIAGVVAAGKYVLCNYNIPRKVVGEATQVTPGRRAATVSPLDDPEWVAVSSMVLKAQVADVMDRLQVRWSSPRPPRTVTESHHRFVRPSEHPISSSSALQTAESNGATSLNTVLCNIE